MPLEKEVSLFPQVEGNAITMRSKDLDKRIEVLEEALRAIVGLFDDDPDYGAEGDAVDIAKAVLDG